MLLIYLFNLCNKREVKIERQWGREKERVSVIVNVATLGNVLPKSICHTGDSGVRVRFLRRRTKNKLFGGIANLLLPSRAAPGQNTEIVSIGVGQCQRVSSLNEIELIVITLTDLDVTWLLEWIIHVRYLCATCSSVWQTNTLNYLLLNTARPSDSASHPLPRI